MRPFPDRFTPIRLARPTRTEVPRVERGSDDLKREVAEVERLDDRFDDLSHMRRRLTAPGPLSLTLNCNGRTDLYIG
jgi:hypothetical protein